MFAYIAQKSLEPVFNLDTNYRYFKPNRLKMFHYCQRTSTIKAEILPKTPREMRSNFQMMPMVLKLVYIDSDIYWFTIRMHFGQN